MKPIKVYSKTINRLKDGRECTPYKINVLFWGNILLSRKAYTHRWFSKTDGCLHLLGFRFTKGIICN